MLSELVCPECLGELEENAGFTCRTCHARYDVDSENIPSLCDHSSRKLAEEIAVQDRVAIEYEMKRYKDVYSKRYHDWWTRQMLADLDLTGRILDNGCGTGLLSEFAPQEKLVGIDISTVMLKMAKNRGYSNLVRGNSMALPFRQNSFDSVVCRSLLHHLPDRVKAVVEISRVLKPGGTAVFSDTNKSVLSSLPRKMANCGEHFSKDHANLGCKDITRLLAEKFSITRIRYFGYIAYPLIAFPDLFSFFRYFPLKNICYPLLAGLDLFLSKTPLLKTQSWGIIVSARKK